MLYEFSSWFNGVDNFVLPVWDRRNEILHAEGSACKVSQTNHTPELRSMALSDKTVEYE